MRLFIAINFTNEVKDNLAKTIKDLRLESIKGSFTRIENLHVTVAFLGEVAPEKVSDIISVVEENTSCRGPITIEIGGLGKFVRQKECLYWCGVKENEELGRLQQALVNGLKDHHFSVDDKPFKPHITLARRCVMKQGFEESRFAQSIPTMCMRVDGISLMKSERIEGRLVYSSIKEVRLQE